MNIDDFLKLNPKNKLVFTKSETAGFVFTDMGHEMSVRLVEQTTPSIAAAATFETVAAKGMKHHPDFGKYLAIKNIGILFEPELRLNLRMLFESISHDTLLIVCSNGIIQNETFYFNEPEDGFAINLSGLSHLVIE